MYVFAKPADIEFPREEVLQLTEEQVGRQMVKQYAENTENMSEKHQASTTPKCL